MKTPVGVGQVMTQPPPRPLAGRRPTLQPPRAPHPSFPGASHPSLWCSPSGVSPQSRPLGTPRLKFREEDRPPGREAGVASTARGAVLALSMCYRF